MAGKFISKEEQKKNPMPIGQFIQKGEPIKEVKSPMSNILQRSIPLAGGAGALAGSYVAGKALETAGKAIYGVTLPPVKAEAEAIQAYKAGITPVKPRTTIQTMLEQPLLQGQPTIRETGKQIWRAPSSVFGEMGTRAQIGVQADVGAKNLWLKKVQPVLDKSKTTINIQSAIDELGDDIVRLAKNDPDKLIEYTKALDELKVSYADPKFANMQLKEVQTLKSGLQGRTPAKFFKGEEITNAYRELRGKLSSKLVNKLHTALSKEAGEDTAQLYRDYNNLKSVAKIGPKALSQAGRMGGAGSFMSWIGEELATPITTTTGKLAYKTGKLLQYLPQKALDMIKKAPSTMKGLPIKSIAKNIIEAAPAGILSEMFGRNITKVASGEIQKEEYKRSLNKLQKGEKLGVMEAVTKSMIKGLDKKDAILLLEKLSQ